MMTDRQGVEIDYCPQCRGVWLDRGELDKLIERSGSDTPAPVRQDRDYHERDSRDHDRRDSDYSSHDGGHKKKRKESFLGDMFDF
jgi:Zn-finger nucleic acid-binding protein